MPKEIHIISFTIPYPPNYGGAIDVFYKIKSLSKLGIVINLHCYTYDRQQSPELNKYCKSVNYYKRPKNIFYFFSKKPFIVRTRSSKSLLRNLLKDSLPILFEGMHTTYFLKQLCKMQRQLIVRTHNIEHAYYNGLAKRETNIFKKIFFALEAIKLKDYQKILSSNVKIAAISENDRGYFESINPNSFLIPAFHPFNDVDIKTGKGDFILYHGDLSVNENIEAATFIIQEICPAVDLQFKIAGRNPNKKLIELVNGCQNIELIANPGSEKLCDLIQNAQINLLVSFQNTGFKLKLVHSLFIGRHCIATKEMISGSQLESLCHIKNEAKDIVSEIKYLFNIHFEEPEINNRRQILLKNVNNSQNGQNLINLLDKN